VVWTPGRVEHWQRTGERPAVAVWTAAQTAQFLHAIAGHRPYAAFHLIALRVLRRDEAAGLRWFKVPRFRQLIDELPRTQTARLAEHRCPKGTSRGSTTRKRTEVQATAADTAVTAVATEGGSRHARGRGWRLAVGGELAVAQFDDPITAGGDRVLGCEDQREAPGRCNANSKSSTSRPVAESRLPVGSSASVPDHRSGPGRSRLAAASRSRARACLSKPVRNGSKGCDDVAAGGERGQQVERWKTNPIWRRKSAAGCCSAHRGLTPRP